MKRAWAALMAAVLMMLCAGVQAEISVGKKDLYINRALDKDVSNILVMLQDGEETDTMMLASINSRTGRAVMTALSTDLMVDTPLTGSCRLGDVYAMGAPKSRGMLAVTTVNRLLDLNVSTYLALDITRLPELAEPIGGVNMALTAAEAEAMDTWEGINGLEGERILQYVRLRLEDDEQTVSRGYETLMQMLYQALNSGDIGGLVNMGGKMLKSMDTNINVLNAMTLVSAVQGGNDRREVFLPGDEQIVTKDPLTADTEAMRAVLSREVYE